MPVWISRALPPSTRTRRAGKRSSLWAAMVRHPMVWVAAAALAAMLGFYVHLVHGQVLRGEETRAALRSADLNKATALTAKQLARVAP